jgi:O-antigen/teichoic acid export membrane protein
VASILILRHGIFPIPQFNKNYLFDLALIGWPFTLAAIFARIYSFADSIILSKLAGDTVVGWYSIAYKITFAFQFVPLALTAALYPKLSQYLDAHEGDFLGFQRYEETEWPTLLHYPSHWTPTAPPIIPGYQLPQQPLIRG